MHGIFFVRYGLLSAALLLYGCETRRDPVSSGPPPVVAGEKHRGVNLVAQSRLPSDTFDHLMRNNVEWVALIPFGWQPRYDVAQIQLRTSGVIWGETDTGLRETAVQARSYGIKTMLKPHIWLRQEVPGQWRGTISFATEGEWQSWEADYRTFILHYAQLAAETGMEVLCLGVELHTAVRDRPAFWQQLIQEVRSLYPGKLIYGANWHQEYRDVGFWEELDYIGIHAYFPLTRNLDATVEELERGWRPYLQEIEDLQRAHEKPVLFTEIGYRSIAGAAIEPWNWTVSRALDLQEQVDSYEALFRTFWHQPWFAGLYIWDWRPDHQGAGGSADDHFSPQNKPAETVLGNWFGRPVDL
jgi:hypothetical protein